MFKSDSPSKIRGLQITDFNYKRGQLIAEAELLGENNELLGTFNMPGIWGDKTREALQFLIKAVEEDMASEQFGKGQKAVIPPEDNYEEAVIHEHVEFEPDGYDIETQF